MNFSLIAWGFTFFYKIPLMDFVFKERKNKSDWFLCAQVLEAGFTRFLSIELNNPIIFL